MLGLVVFLAFALLLMAVTAGSARNGQRAAKAEAAEAHARADKADASLYAAAQGLVADREAMDRATTTLDELSRTRDKLDAEVTQLRRISAENERKCGEYQSVIGAVHEERDRWKRMYWQESAEHGVAQAMLYRAVGNLIVQLRAAGKKPKVSATLQQVLEEHREKRAMPAWEALGQTPAPMPPADQVGA